MEIKLSPGSVFKPAEGITWRDIKGELIVLQLASGEYFSFNEIGRSAWLALAEMKSMQQVIEADMAARPLLTAPKATVSPHADPMAALTAALAGADPTDRIVVFGSFYTVGGVLHEGLPKLNAPHLQA